MKKVLIGVGVFLAVAVGGVLGAAAMQPDELLVERSATIGAPVDHVMPLCTDLRAWSSWSPWDELDPDMTLTYSEPSDGVGASYSWEGNENVGKGSMRIVSIDDTSVVYDLEFKEPFEDQATVTLEMTPAGDGSTEVTWRMEGENDFMGKMIGLFMDMEGMIGGDFERGLDNLAEEVARAQAVSGEAS